MRQLRDVMAQRDGTSRDGATLAISRSGSRAAAAGAAVIAATAQADMQRLITEVKASKKYVNV